MNVLLYQLQQLDNRLAALKRERGKLDDGSKLRAERDTLQKAVEAEKHRLAKLTSDRTDKEFQLKTMEEKLARQGERLMNAKSAHEVTSLQRDIAGLTTARGGLDEAVLILMDEMESASASLAELEQKLVLKVTETQEMEDRFAADVSRLEGEMTSARAERDKLAGQLDEDQAATYDTYTKRFHGIAVAFPDHGNCSACGMALTPYNLRAAKDQEYPTCESCNRLLYVGPLPAEG